MSKGFVTEGITSRDVVSEASKVRMVEVSSQDNKHTRMRVRMFIVVGLFLWMCQTIRVAFMWAFFSAKVNNSLFTVSIGNVRQSCCDVGRWCTRYNYSLKSCEIGFQNKWSQWIYYATIRLIWLRIIIIILSFFSHCLFLQWADKGETYNSVEIKQTKLSSSSTSSNSNRL